jgi:hypothetical protein
VVKTLRALILFLLFSSTCFAHSFDEYNAAFIAFAKYHNKEISTPSAQELASLNWGLAKHRWTLAVVLAEIQGAETGFKVMATIKPRESYVGIPRSDFSGTHYNVIAKQLTIEGYCDCQKNWLYSDDFDDFKKEMILDPCFGTFFAMQPFVRKFEAVGRVRACHWWQSGDDSFPDPNDVYLTALSQQMNIFYRFVPGAPRKRATKKTRRL